MAIRALSLASVRHYQSKYDEARGTDDATVFDLGTLDSRIVSRIRDNATKFVVDQHAPDEEVETSIQQYGSAYETVQYGLRGVSKLLDADGNEVAFVTKSRRHGGVSYPIVSDEVMAVIPADVIKELADEILKGNVLEEAAAKK